MLSICVSSAFAQDAVVTKFPNAVFVMLSSEQNRIKGAILAHQMKAVAEIEHDAAEIIKVTKLDFHDHLTYAPVYYFMDTVREQVKNGVLDGVIMNEDGSIATHVPKSKYIIAYYGYPDINGQSDRLLRKGLVITNEQMKQLDNRSTGIIHTHKMSNGKTYRYTSKHYDIEYKPVANILNWGLEQQEVK